MIYDKTPQPYAHFEHLPFAKEPLKAVYVFQRLFTTLVLVPYWVAYYGLLPRTYRPRSSWGLKQIVYVNFTRRIYKVVEVAGVTFNTRDPDSEPAPGTLKETRFEWAPPLHESLRDGAVVDVYGRVSFKRVGTFVWPKVPPIFHDEAPLIGIFMHGGGYCQMSAHENARTSHIPRRLMSDGRFSEIYSVEYRLLQHAPFPAVIIDGAAVYAHVLKTRPNAKIILIGDSSGGNLVLALARWIRDQNELTPPAGLLLLSPSCDTSHAFPDVPSAYVARPHASTDYLTDTPEPRALLQRTFLGFKYRPRNVGWHDLNRDGSDQMERHLGFFTRFRRNHQQPDSVPASDGIELKAEVEEEQRRLHEIIHSEYVSPASPKVLRRWGHDVDLYDGGKDGPSLTLQQLGIDPGTPICELPPVLQPENVGLFAGFPKTMVVIGDAERLTIEVGNLVRAMEMDGVEMKARWVKDAVHDVLMIPPGWWDDDIRNKVWRDIGEWTDGIKQH